MAYTLYMPLTLVNIQGDFFSLGLPVPVPVPSIRTVFTDIWWPGLCRGASFIVAFPWLDRVNGIYMYKCEVSLLRVATFSLSDQRGVILTDKYRETSLGLENIQNWQLCFGQC